MTELQSAAASENRHNCVRTLRRLVVHNGRYIRTWSKHASASPRPFLRIIMNSCQDIFELLVERVIVVAPNEADAVPAKFSLEMGGTGGLQSLETGVSSVLEAESNLTNRFPNVPPGSSSQWVRLSIVLESFFIGKWKSALYAVINEEDATYAHAITRGGLSREGVGKLRQATATRKQGRRGFRRKPEWDWQQCSWIDT